jgi:hypothetical protein
MSTWTAELLGSRLSSSSSSSSSRKGSSSKACGAGHNSASCSM